MAVPTSYKDLGLVNTKQIFNIPSDKLILGFIGSVSYRKGIDVLIATDLISHTYQHNFDVAILCCL